MLPRILISLIMLTPALTCADEYNAKVQLLEAVRHVDRLIIVPSDMPPPMNGADRDNALFEIRGRDKITDLVQQLEFEPAPNTFASPCLCYGTHKIEFYSGNRFKFEFTYHHWDRLRGGFGAPWLTDAVLSTQGSEALIEWFTHQGFPDFEIGKSQVDAHLAEREALSVQIAALFPAESRPWIPAIHHNRSWDKETEKHRKELVALYEDKSDLVLDAWHAFGLLASRSISAVTHLYGEPNIFLNEALSNISPDDLNRALLRLPDADSMVWLGAFRHYASLAKDNTGAKPNWLAGWPERLAAHCFAREHPEAKLAAVEILHQIGSPEAIAQLLKIGTKALLKKDKELVQGEHLSYLGQTAPAEVMALYYLAKDAVPEARFIIEEKLKDAPVGQDRLTLEIALAHYGNSPPLDARHLNCTADHGKAAEIAWKILLPADGQPASVDLLLTGYRSANFGVKHQAEMRLAEMGLQPYARPKSRADIYSLIDRHLTTQQAINACTELIVSRPGREMTEMLHARRGLAYFKIGEYEKAMVDLQKTGENLEGSVYTAYDQAFLAFAVVRYEQAWQIAARNAREAKATNYLKLLGGISYVTGKFAEAEDYFTASHTTSGDDLMLIHRHLTLLQLGGARHSPLQEWVPWSDNLEPAWPDDLIKFLQGKMDKASMLRSAAHGHHESHIDVSLAHWALSQVARAKGDPTTERAHLEQCIAAKAFTSLAHAMALARLQEFEEIVTP